MTNKEEETILNQAKPKNKKWWLPLEYHTSASVEVIAPTQEEAWEIVEDKWASLDIDSDCGDWSNNYDGVEDLGETDEPVGLAGQKNNKP